jgi:hypothetical protein
MEFAKRTLWMNFLTLRDSKPLCNKSSKYSCLRPPFAEIFILMLTCGADMDAINNFPRHHYNCLSNFLLSSKPKAKQLKEYLGRSWIIPQPVHNLDPVIRMRPDVRLSPVSSMTSLDLNPPLQMQPKMSTEWIFQLG